MSVIRCKVKGKNIDIRASDISAYKAEENGTTVLMNNGSEFTVDESFQAVRNRVSNADGLGIQRRLILVSASCCPTTSTVRPR